MYVYTITEVTCSFAHLTKYVRMLSPPHIQSGATPLYIASQNGHKDVVTILLRNGADVNLRFKVRTVYAVV